MKPIFVILLIGISIAIAGTVGYFVAKRNSDSSGTSCSCGTGKSPTAQLPAPTASDPNAAAYQNSNLTQVR